ncbi:MAG: molecular chaperone HscC [Acidocella sp. 20-57-95]|nr:MAG: molecular chaperone HscC [Acidocella sp. 20-57-95]OYV60871.1 MAG: molecular chaperone HscC [Acidocella sp. 21-58-7]HQT63489.1 molecular chaperone HscC [Acidocella sp.]HQU04493.1 molecular chaperone HscC [Acidocella sp.]
MIVGIDLGTTNSLIAVWRHGEPVLIPNAIGHVLTPSAVSLDEKGDIIVGLAARERLSTHPARTAAVFKRYMGTNRELHLGKKEFRPEELSALVLRSLKADAEALLGEPVTEAVITVPAYFNDLQRKATKAAGTLAGLEVKRLLTEPTAAALAYGIGLNADEQYLMVIDLGGGTFDVSLLHCFEGVMEVRATAGDTWLGGEDFVDVIVHDFMAHMGEAAGLPPVSLLAPIHGVLRRQAEMVKRRLSEADEAELSLAYQGKDLTWTLSRDRFEMLSESVLARIRLPIERALRDARIKPEILSQVILAGGATRMPMLRRLIGRLFRRMPLQHINPDEVVARGAAVAAGLIGRSAGLEEIIMTDVAPFTMGINVSDRQPDGSRLTGVYMPIIERNTIIPASRVKPVFNVEDNQTAISLQVYQGEALMVKDNILLGKMSVRCPPAPEGKVQIDVRFTYDTSGLLEVEATVLNTGVTERLLIEGNPGSLSREEIEARLQNLTKLKLHPRDDAENAALMARGQRLYEQRLGHARSVIGDALTGFISALEAQAPERIRTTREHLRQVLEAHDDEPFI